MLRSSTFAYITLVLCRCNNTITISVYILNVSRQCLIAFNCCRICYLFLALKQTICDKTIFRTDLLSCQTLIFRSIVWVAYILQPTTVCIWPDQLGTIIKFVDTVVMSQSNIETFIISLVHIGRTEIISTSWRRVCSGHSGQFIIFIFIEYVKFDS